MKRLLAVMSAVVIMTAFQMFAVAAETEITLTDSIKGSILVTGSAQSGDNVTLLILNPGYELTDAASNAGESVQYLKSKKADENGFSFEVDLNTKTGGIYKIYTTSGGVQSKSSEFEFYPADIKAEVIQKLNDTTDISEALLDEAMRIFSLKNTDLYQSVGKNKMLEALKKIKASQSGGKFAYDPDAVYAGLRQCLVLAAYNDSSKLVFADNYIKYSDVLGISETAEYGDYMQSLSSSGRSKLNTALLNGNYDSIKDFSDAFCEYLAYYVITDYCKLGYGHVPVFLNKYKTIYSDNGFKLVSNVSNTVYSQMVSSNTGSLSSLAALYNSLTAVSSSGISQGGSSGGGGGGSSPALKTQSPAVNSGSVYYQENRTQVFRDLDDSHWSFEYVIPLYEMGIINGYDDSYFAPSDNITRAEFVKMITLAMGLENSGGDMPFADTENHWGRTYISTAYKNGLISGVSGVEFAPDEYVTREQGATIIYRALEKQPAETDVKDLFGDDSEISDYAKDAVYALKDSGIIAGRENNSFAPSAHLTRAESSKMIFLMLRDGGLIND